MNIGKVAWSDRYGEYILVNEIDVGEDKVMISNGNGIYFTDKKTVEGLKLEKKGFMILNKDFTVREKYRGDIFITKEEIDE